jgi:hypothetical protein
MLALLMPGNVVPGAEPVNRTMVLPGFAACQPSPALFEQETSARAESPTPALGCHQHSDGNPHGEGAAGLQWWVYVRFGELGAV